MMKRFISIILIAGVLCTNKAMSDLDLCFEKRTSVKDKILCTEKFNDYLYQECKLSHDESNKKTDEMLNRIFKKRKFNKDK